MNQVIKKSKRIGLLQTRFQKSWDSTYRQTGLNILMKSPNCITLIEVKKIIHDKVLKAFDNVIILNYFTLNTALPWVLSDTPAMCEVDQVSF